jgi:hypothetical protein
MLFNMKVNIEFIKVENWNIIIHWTYIPKCISCQQTSFALKIWFDSINFAILALHKFFTQSYDIKKGIQSELHPFITFKVSFPQGLDQLKKSYHVIVLQEAS